MQQPTQTLSALTGSILAALTLHAHADVITDWNLITANATKVAPALNSNLASRIGAIEAIAVYDAVNSIRQFGTPYHYHTPPTGPASAEAAAAEAAHHVLVNYFPAQTAALDASLATSLAAIPDGAEKTAGLAVGAAAAADIIALRAADGSSPNSTYPGPANPGTGEWRPTPTAFAEGINLQWGAVTPFVIKKSAHFAPPKPPTVGSKDYKKALAAVRDIGCATSATRTEEQTHIAQFFKQDAELTVNEAARQLAQSHGLNIEEGALLFALVDIAVADARIATWLGKYNFKYWRPVTALNADPDGVVRNGYTSWTPLLTTPAHPSYASGHSATVNAGIDVLRHFFGEWGEVELHTTTPGEPSRTYRHLADIEAENGQSRIYGGIHYDFDNLAGQKTGSKVAAYVLKNGPQFND
jgi:hypothetical protein